MILIFPISKNGKVSIRQDISLVSLMVMVTKSKNLNVDQPNDRYVSLFGQLKSATIRNLTLENFNITSIGRTGFLASRGKKGYDGTPMLIENCHITGNYNSKESIAGFIGTTYDTEFIGCSYKGKLTTSSRAAGGLFTSGKII